MNKDIKCEQCNGHVSFDKESDVLRCENCGSIVDHEGMVIYENA